MAGFNFLQCKICGKPFNSTGSRICTNCLVQIEEDLGKIKEYLYHNPGCLSIEELSEVTEVPEEVILHLIDEDRLMFELPTDMAEELARRGIGKICSVCRKPILSGTMCDDCKSNLSQSLSGVLPRQPEKEKKPLYSEKEKSKMHLDHKRGK